MENYRLYKGAWIGIDEKKEMMLTPHECNSMLMKGGVLVRNVCSFDVDKQKSFWYLIKDSFGGIEELSSTARRYVRRAL